jgi:uncharacterized membrane protein
MLKKVVKLLHELGAIGFMGSLAACLVLVATSPKEPGIAYAAVRAAIAAVVHWLLVPSLVVVLISGLLAIMVNDAYLGAGWAWAKALLGLSMFEGALVTIGSSARRALQLSSSAAAGQGDPNQLREVLRTEWGGIWLLLALCIANVVLAVWRPRFERRMDRSPTDGPSG